MEDRPPEHAPVEQERPEDAPQVATALRELERAVRAADPEDRAFVIDQLKALAKRLDRR